MILGAIIAGGQARRFGGDKALALLDGLPLIDHVAAALRGHVGPVVVCGRDLPGYSCLADRPHPDLGPLGGINAALAHGAGQGFAAVLTLPCDTPRLDPSLLAALTGATQASYLADLPVIGLWPTALSAALDRHLATSDDRSIRRWARSIGAAALDLAAPANINRRSDLEPFGA